MKIKFVFLLLISVLASNFLHAQSGCSNVYYLDSDSDGYGTSAVFSGETNQNYGSGQYLGSWGQTINFPTTLNNLVSFNYSVTNTAAMSQCIFRFYSGANLVASVEAYPQNGWTISTNHNFTSPLFGITSVQVFSYWNPAYLNSLTFLAVPSSVIACTQPIGYSSNNTDCNDGNSTVNPGIFDICNTIDDNCDGQVDNGMYYADADGDGYGVSPYIITQENSTVTITSDLIVLNGSNNLNGSNGTDILSQISFVVPTTTTYTFDWSYVTNDYDGPGYDPAYYINNVLVPLSNANGSNLQSGSVSINVTAGSIFGFAVVSSDGEGGQASLTISNFNGISNVYGGSPACVAPSGYVPNRSDCNDNLSAIHPGATEICNSFDDDCDSQVDEGVITTYYSDIDGDGYGVNPGITTQENSTVIVTDNQIIINGSDSFLQNPGGAVQSNISFVVPQNATYTFDWSYVTTDESPNFDPAYYMNNVLVPLSNNFGVNSQSGSVSVAVNAGSTFGFAVVSTDGVAGSATLTITNFSGMNNFTAGVSACSAPAGGYVANNDDCNDSRNNIHPGVTELCNSFDDDCDGQIDQGLNTYYADNDGDGFGAGPVTITCEQEVGFVLINGDCNDNSFAIKPSATELCNSVDDDCDGIADDGLSPQLTNATSCGPYLWSQNSTTYNSSGTYYANLPAATNYNSYASFASASNSAGYQISETEDFDEFWGYTESASGTFGAGFPTWSATAYTGFYNIAINGSVALASNQFASPLTFNFSSGVTGVGGNFCVTTVLGAIMNHTINFSLSDGTTHSVVVNSYSSFTGFISNSALITSITINTPYTSVSNPYVRIDNLVVTTGTAPGIPCSAKVLQLVVNNPVLYYPDLDSDGYGAGTSSNVCAQPSGYVANNGDCNNNNAAINPGAVEVCNGVDDDCDSQSDDGLAAQISNVESCGPYTWSANNTTYNSSGTYYVNPPASTTYNSYASFATASNSAGYQVSETEDFNEFWEYSAGASGTLGDGFPTWYAVANTGFYCIPVNGSVALAPNDFASPITIYFSSGVTGVGGNFCITNVQGTLMNHTIQFSLSDGTTQTLNVNSYNSFTGFLSNGALITSMTLSTPWTSVDNPYVRIDNLVVTTGTAPALPCTASALVLVVNNLGNYYADMDGDGFGAGTETVTCYPPVGFVSNSSDCDDAVSTSYPGAIEVCNVVDDNCDGQIDEGLNTYYVDIDGDGFGAGSAVITCNPSIGFVANNADCNDNAIAMNPDAIEICNSIDDNCDGDVDEGLFNNYYADTDGDGFGGDAVTETLAWGSSILYEPALFVLVGSSDYITGVSNSVQFVAPATETYTFDWAYAILDDPNQDPGYYFINSNVYQLSDNWGALYQSGSVSVQLNAGDIFGFGINSWDDEAGPVWLEISNFNAYSYMGIVVACSQPVGYLVGNTDCDFDNAAVYPGATEICNDIDDNCDSEIDEGVQNTYYVDADLDGYGGNSTILACTVPAGFSYNNLDCNENVASINPGANEICNGIDDNCNGQSDEGVQSTFYYDGDNDGFGTSAVFSGETAQNYGASQYLGSWGHTFNFPTPLNNLVTFNYSITNTAAMSQCIFRFYDGGNLVASVEAYPQNGETISTGHNFTTPLFNITSVVVFSYWNPAYLNSLTFNAIPSSVIGCTPPAGYAANNTDCDDYNANINPGEIDICNTLDDDCDLGVDNALLYVDADSDGFGDNQSVGVLVCLAPVGYVANNDDCDDTVDSVYLGSTEVCNNIDDDCDTQIDEGVQNSYYADTDVDGFGAGTATLACAVPNGFVTTNTDCNNTNASVYPGATEVCNTIDDDCDSQIDEGVQNNYYADTDGDGYGAGTVTLACTAPTGFVSTNTDCNNTSGTVNPGATEVCNSIDDDCDTQIDEGVQNSYYADLDGDGYGSGAVTMACSAPIGMVGNNTDCDDAEAAVSPGATESCNSIDDDCDGGVDEFGTSPTAQVVSSCGPYAWSVNNTSYNSSGTYYANIPSASTINSLASFTSASTVAGYQISETEDFSEFGGYFTSASGNFGVGFPSWSATGVSGFFAYEVNGSTAIAANQYASALTFNFSTGVTGVGGNFFVSDVFGNVISNTVDITLSDGTTQSLWIGSSDSFTGYISNGTTITSITINTPWIAQTNPYVRVDNLVVLTGTPVIPCSANILQLTVNTPTSYYADLDGDGFGAGAATNVCSQPSGYVSNNTDCDDALASVNSGAPEICNSIDDDCDAQIDEGLTFANYYADLDGDGYGAGTATNACVQPTGFVTTNTDCNNNNTAINPAAIEACNSIDDDCDAQIDEGVQPNITNVVSCGPYTWNENNTAYNSSGTYYANIPSASTFNSLASFTSASTVAGYQISQTEDFSEFGGYFTSASGNFGAGFPSWSATGVSGFFAYQVNGSTAIAANQYASALTFNFSAGVTGVGGNFFVSDVFGNVISNTVNITLSDGTTQSLWIGSSDSFTGYISNGTPITSITINTPWISQTNPYVRVDNLVVLTGTPVVACSANVLQLTVNTPVSFFADSDGDGYGAGTATAACTAPAGYVATNTDCDNTNASLNPGATEVCNSIDDDCDTQIDEGVQNNYYADTDGDGYGSGVATLACTAPTGFVTTNTDCNNSNAAINPAATEVCNSIDDDCDTQIDEGVQNNYFADTDGDGYGAGTATAACTAPVGYVSTNTDCDNTNAAVNPTASEVCNSIDDDCNAQIDEGVQNTYYADLDGDGYAGATTTNACTLPAGYFATNTDCNDNNVSVNPSTTEICNSIDDDCDTQIDEGVQNNYYADTDGDGYGAGPVTNSCVQPIGYVTTNTDCNNTNASINPNAAEVCNSIDDDCDTQIDEGVQNNYYVDTDGDGYGSGIATLACTAPTGYVSTNTDCNNNSESVNPAAIEVCNSIDDDCDTQIDEGVQNNYYADTDGDGYGAGTATTACTAPFGYVSTNTDCNSTNASINPGATEVCNSIDEDCDTQIDEGVQNTYYADLDGDGYAGATTTNACTLPVGYFATNTDCNDNNASVNPSTTEICNNIDDNCNGQSDEGFSLTAFYQDADGDGFGVSSGILTSGNATIVITQDGVVINGSNDITNDTDLQDVGGLFAFVVPNNTTYTFDWNYITNDEGGPEFDVAYYLNNDLIQLSDDDGGNVQSGTVSVNVTAGSVFGFAVVSDDNVLGGASLTITNFSGISDYNGGVLACTAPVGYVSNSTDCNDELASVNPVANEICNSADDDCDSQVDEGLVLLTYYLDDDGDGYGSGDATLSCIDIENYVLSNTDCDDDDENINPLAIEVCENGIDENCDGIDLPCAIVGCTDALACNYNPLANSSDASCIYGLNFYADADGDGYGAGNVTIACTAPSGMVANNTDCNDNSTAVNPGATEICNLTDDDCDSSIDEGLPLFNYYSDLDGDTYGGSLVASTCAVLTGNFVVIGGDCNDANIAVNPGAVEICLNSIDDDCDGNINDGCLPDQLAGESPATSQYVWTNFYPTCVTQSHTLAGFTPSLSSQSICLTGEDKWHYFTATSEAVSIVVASSANDILLELQNASGSLIATENAVSGLGGEILNFSGLVSGQVYKVGVRNYNSALGIGSYTLCVKMLKRGGCDYGPGPYSLCQYFKASFAGAGAVYTFTFTGLTGNAAGNVYTRTQSSDICVLSNVSPSLPYGSTYNVLITSTYNLLDAAGNTEILAVPALSPCTMSTVAQPSTSLRTADQCINGTKFRGAIVASLPWVCGVTNWRWEFTEVNPITLTTVGLPIAVNRGAASNYINLGTVAALQHGKTYAVRTAPILPNTGSNYQWGSTYYMCIIGSPGMVVENNNASSADTKSEIANEVNMSLYPNPTHGTDVNINLSGVTSDNVQIRVVDAMGRQVWSNRYAVDGILNTNITFEQPLANGLYFVEAIFNGEVQTQRLMVQK